MGLAADIEQIGALARAIDPACCDNPCEAVLTVERVRHIVEALAGELLVELHQSGEWARDGATSAANWTAALTGAATPEVRARLQVAERLRQLPEASVAARAGEFGTRQRKQLAECVRAFPDLAARDDQILSDAARTLLVKGFDVVIRQWRDRAADTLDIDPEPDREAEIAAEPNKLWLSRTFGGRWSLSADLQPDIGEMLNGLVQRGFEGLTRARRDGDPSLEGYDAPMLRGEALADLIANSSRREPGQYSAPDRYRASLVLTPEQLADPPAALCDSPIFRLVSSAPGEVLNLGRETKFWSRALRRHFVFRDGGCIFPGCDRPPSWCDIHHCCEWRHGGETSHRNGALLCRRRHSFLHARQWYVKFIDDKPIVHTSTGDRYELNRWCINTHAG